MENHLIYYLETYTSSEIIAQTTTFTVWIVVLHHFFKIFPCFHYQTFLITDAKVIYYIGTAIRANGDLLPALTEVDSVAEIPPPNMLYSTKGTNKPLKIEINLSLIGLFL